jgi:hypothetical protein
MRAMTPRDWVVVAAVSALLAFLISGRIEQALAPDPVIPITWLDYDVVEDTARAGDVITLTATRIRPRIDCTRTGQRQVVLYERDREIRTYETPPRMPLIEGDLGEAEASGPSQLPHDLPPGRVGIRSVAVYACPEGDYVVVSPWADLVIVE